MKFITLFSITMLALLATCSHAQITYTRLDYNINFPLGHMAGYINKPSFRGASVELGGILSNRFMIGLKAAWMTYNQHIPRSTFDIGESTINAEQFRYINSIPVLAKGTFFVLNSEDIYTTIQPYLSLGTGISYLELKNNIGLSEDVQKGWCFTLNPEAGAIINLSSHTAINVSANYYQYFKTSQYGYLNSLGISIGLLMRR